MAKKGKSSSYRAHQKTIRDADRFMRQEGEKRRRESSGSGSGGGHNRRGNFGQSVGTTLGVMGAVASPGLETLPGGQDYGEATGNADWGRTHLRAEGDRQSNDMDEATRDEGSRTHGTSQQD